MVMGERKEYIYVTKYVLTSGIIEGEAVIDRKGYAHFFNAKGQLVVLPPREFCYDMPGAKAKSKEMRILEIEALRRKIASAERRIERIKSINLY
jgi:hypothetical protein